MVEQNSLVFHALQSRRAVNNVCPIVACIFVYLDQRQNYNWNFGKFWVGRKLFMEYGSGN